jgi:hypothetical protein
MSTTEHSRSARGAPALPTEGLRHRLPIDLVLGVALIVLAVVGRSFMESTEERDARPYIGAWTAMQGASSATLVIERDHEAHVGRDEARWRLVPPPPSRFPGSPSLALDLPDGTVLHATVQQGDLVTWDGKTTTRWSRAKSPPTVLAPL